MPGHLSIHHSLLIPNTGVCMCVLLYLYKCACLFVLNGNLYLLYSLTSLIRDVSGDIYGLPDEHTSPQGFPGASTLGAEVDCQSAAKLKAAKISQHQLWPTVFGLKSQERLSSYAQTEGYLKDIGKAILSLFHESKHHLGA